MGKVEKIAGEIRKLDIWEQIDLIEALGWDKRYESESDRTFRERVESGEFDEDREAARRDIAEGKTIPLENCMKKTA